MKLSTYVVGQGDTIEILASQLMGDISQSDTLIQINKLRYPYISDDPMDQYAMPKGTVLLNGTFTNPTTITINNTNAIVISPGDTLFLLEGNYATGIVQSIVGSTITFQNTITGAFDQGAIVTVFPNQQNITTQVLRTGDTLLYPYNPGTNTSNASAATTDYSLLFGTDWALDNNGFLQRVNHDLATVTGLDNLMQSLIRRWQTPKGSLKLHPTYGNGVFFILGEGSSPYFSSLAKYYITECALQDPRVQSIDVDNLMVINDQMLFDTIITPIGSQDPISQPIAIPIGGVT